MPLHADAVHCMSMSAVALCMLYMAWPCANAYEATFDSDISFIPYKFIYELTCKKYACDVLQNLYNIYFIIFMPFWCPPLSVVTKRTNLAVQQPVYKSLSFFIILRKEYVYFIEKQICNTFEKNLMKNKKAFEFFRL